jgi:hypothetical protein
MSRLSPRALLRLGLTLVAFFLALHLAGLRESTTFLSGTPGGSAYAGVLYTLAWFAAVLVAPPLVIAAAILAVATRGTEPPETPNASKT